jgi:hypothetical protein
MMKNLLTLALVAMLLVACGPSEKLTEEQTVSFHLMIYSDGVDNGDGTWGKVTVVQAETEDGTLYYQSLIEGTKVHSGVDYDLDGQPDMFADADLIVGETLFLYDPDGNYYGELILLEDGTVNWTPPSDAEYFPPTTPSAPANAG